MQNDNQFNTINFDEDTINLREEVEKYMYHWKWFVLSLFIAISCAFLYLRYTPNQYEVSTTILIADEKKGGLASELSAFEDLGLFGSSQTLLENEIELLKSRSLFERVVKDLELNVAYFKQGRIIESELFKNNSSLKVNFFSKDSVFCKIDTTFSIAITSPNSFVLKNTEGIKIKEGAFGENITTNFGDITVTPTTINKIKTGEELIVKISPLKKVIDRYKNRIQIQPVNKKSSVIKISLKDPVKQKAQVILNSLVKHYNKDAVNYKNLIAKNTNKFINQRLTIITKDLSNVDKGVEELKTKYNLTDIAAEASLILHSNSELENKIIELTTQINLVDFVKEYISENTNDLVPENLGLADASLSGSTIKYNELILERNRILKSSSEKNPVIVNLNTQLTSLRESIAQSIVNLKSSLIISLNNIKKQEQRLSSKIALVPKQEREFTDIQRQRKIVESIYLYLLQKREENAISLAVTLPNSKIIDVAYGSDIPVAPKRKIVYLAALLLGLIVPFTVIYLVFLLDNKIHTRKDVEAVVKAPILGDIPKTKTEKKLVVSDSDRSGPAESFRLLRTNINFMLSGVKEKAKTIFITSTLASEGKTFIAINLASVLALTNKKVLLIGADIRRPKIAEYLNVPLPKKGLSHYLMDTNLKISEVITHVKETNFDIIESGVIVPNPSELLMNGRFDEILAYGKENYDYVIVDTSPVNMVTDTLLLGGNANLFVYVIRVNYLDKRLLDIPKIMYENKRLPNMAILLNDVDFERGYGYGYGYGYGEVEVEKPWWKKMFLKK